MKVVYDSKLKANLSMDETGRVRSISQSEPHLSAEQDDAVAAAISYLHQASAAMEVGEIELSSAGEQVSFFAPEDRGSEYRLSEVKERFGSTTVGFYQTYLNLLVWQAGVSVSVKQGPNRVTGALNTSQTGLDATLPAPDKIERFRKLVGANTGAENGLAPADQAAEGAVFVRSLVDKPVGPGEAAGNQARLIRGRLFVYRYEADKRLPKPHEAPAEPVEGGIEPVLPLKPVPGEIQDGHCYVVAEVTFTYATEEYGRLNWQALVELETEAVLYLRALVSGVNGMVFRRDPATQGSAVPSSGTNAQLNPFRSSELLPRLQPPDGAGIQSLRGDFANVTDVEAPNIAPPTQPAGNDFNYDVRTNDFAAVNAYYHVDAFFAELESLGYDRATYFGGTTFPIDVDHRGMGAAYGNTINAWCIGNGAGGIDYVAYALGDTTDTIHPLGRATDSRVTWHELGGHGVLYDHVNSANFGFCHSAGDSLSIIRHDPDSQAADRGRYAPWNPINTRRVDRTLAAGWGFGGGHDDGGYGTEEILASTMFRVYRAIGGDSGDLPRRQFASRVMQWLILHTIEKFTPATNPNGPDDFADMMMIADEDNWTIGGYDGPCYGKIVRWSLVQQGLAGLELPVDVYIEDGRHGEYTYLDIHWENPSIWNRLHPDGSLTHEQAVPGVTNYAYVKVKNRGTLQAQNVRVRGYHCKPSAGVLWPNDLQPMTTAELLAGTVNPNNTEEKIVGPFEWTPNANAWGHDCMMMIVTADGDDTIVSNLVAGEVLADWRLVPNDNNFGQRNVVFAPASTPEALFKWLDGLTFYVANPNTIATKINLRVELPNVLSSRGWRLAPEGIKRNKFELGPREERVVVLRVNRGKDFDPIQLRRAKSRTARVKAYSNGLLIGGMTYRLAPMLGIG